jgi:hypothetical protein
MNSAGRIECGLKLYRFVITLAWAVLAFLAWRKGNYGVFGWCMFCFGVGLARYFPPPSGTRIEDNR